MTWRGVVLAGCVLLAAVPRAQAQRVWLSDAHVGLNFDGSWLDYQLSAGERRLGFREYASFELTGDVIDRRIFGFRASVRPAFAQRSSATVTQTIDTRQFGFDANVNVLAAKPVSLTFSATRTQGTTSGEFGTLSDFLTAQLRGRLAWRNRYLPVSLEYNQQSRDNSWRPATQNVIIRLNELVRTLRLSARNSKTGLLLERVVLDDRAGERDFTAYRATVDHALRWGKGSSLSSSLQYLDRAGTFPFERFAWAERLHIQHTQKLSTNYRYRFLDLETVGSSLTGRSASASFTYRILPTLSVGAQAFRQSSSFQTGRQVNYGAGPNVGFALDLPLGMRFSSGFSVGFERLNREAEDGFASAVGEQHIIDDSERFFLDNPNPDASTVVVSSADRTVIFLAEADYRLVDIDALIEIQILPGSRIAIGDTVLVDYRYLVTPTDRHSYLLASYNSQLSIAGLQLFLYRTLRDGQILEGPGLGFAESDDSRIGLRWRRSARATTLELLAERRDYEVTDFRSISYLMRGAFSRALGERVNVALTASGSRSTAQQQRITLVSTNLVLRWIPASTLRLQTQIGTWHWTQQGAASERFIGGGVTAEWRIGLVDAVARYDHNRWRIEFSRVENRLSVQLVRRFF